MLIVRVFPSVPAKVRLAEAARVLPLVISKVPVVVSIIKPLIEVAVATPKTGVTKVGLVDLTKFPEPVVATRLTAEVPFPTKTEPEVKVASPVPPLFTEIGVVNPLRLVISELAPEVANPTNRFDF